MFLEFNKVRVWLLFSCSSPVKSRRNHHLSLFHLIQSVLLSFFLLLFALTTLSSARAALNPGSDLLLHLYFCYSLYRLLYRRHSDDVWSCSKLGQSLSTAELGCSEWFSCACTPAGRCDDGMMKSATHSTSPEASRNRAVYLCCQEVFMLTSLSVSPPLPPICSACHSLVHLTYTLLGGRIHTFKHHKANLSHWTEPRALDTSVHSAVSF